MNKKWESNKGGKIFKQAILKVYKNRLNQKEK